MTEQSDPSEDEEPRDNLADDEVVLAGAKQIDSKLGEYTPNSESTGESEEPELEEPDVQPPDRTQYDRLDEEQNVAPLDVDDDTLVLDVNATEDDHASQPDAPELGDHRFLQLETIHVLGDLHGWAPGLITYLIEHNLASIEINGLSLGVGGSIDARAMLKCIRSRFNNECL